MLAARKPDSAVSDTGMFLGSRGSVIPVFQRQSRDGIVTVTDERMTRFWLSIDQGVHFTIRCIEQMHGGEVFIPKIPSMRILDVAKAIAPEAEIEIIGIRPGEKLHEVLVSEDESRHTIELDDMFVVEPAGAFWFGHSWHELGQRPPEGYSYTSNNNEQWLTNEEIGQLLGGVEIGQ